MLNQVLILSVSVVRITFLSSLCITGLVNQTYLQLETLLTQISLSFQLEDSKRLFIYTLVIAINAKTARTS
jgi:hypothetical protein